MLKNKMYFNWSTGKDSALALHHLLHNHNLRSLYQVEHLLTSINKQADRVSMHGLSRDLFEVQLASIGLPFSTIELPENPNMETYAKLMLEKVNQLHKQGFTHAGFGDIFLEDLKLYRQKQLAEHKIECVFPLWKRDTNELIAELLDLDYKTIVVCVDMNKLDTSFCGRVIDRDFIKDLPKGVDPCGENGEYHSFCFSGPIFNKAINFDVGNNKIVNYPAPIINGDTNSDTKMDADTQIKTKAENYSKNDAKTNSCKPVEQHYQFCFTDLILKN